MFGIALSKTVVITTQEDVTVLAVPHWCLLFVVVAVVATSTVLCSSNGIVGLAETTHSEERLIIVTLVL